MTKVLSWTKNVLFKAKLSTNYIANMSFSLLLEDFQILQWNLYKADTIGAKKVSAL